MPEISEIGSQRVIYQISKEKKYHIVVVMLNYTIFILLNYLLLIYDVIVISHDWFLTSSHKSGK